MILLQMLTFIPISIFGATVYAFFAVCIHRLLCKQSKWDGFKYFLYAGAAPLMLEPFLHLIAATTYGTPFPAEPKGAFEQIWRLVHGYNILFGPVAVANIVVRHTRDVDETAERVFSIAMAFTLLAWCMIGDSEIQISAEHEVRFQRGELDDPDG